MIYRRESSRRSISQRRTADEIADIADEIAHPDE